VKECKGVSVSEGRRETVKNYFWISCPKCGQLIEVQQHYEVKVAKIETIDVRSVNQG
jgi:hypothetical protein